MRFLIKLKKYGVLKESTKNTDGFQQKIKSESAIRTARLQKNNKKKIIQFAVSQIPLF